MQVSVTLSELAHNYLIFGVLGSTFPKTIKITIIIKLYR